SRSCLDSSTLRPSSTNSHHAAHPSPPSGSSPTMERVYPGATLERICADAWPPIVTERIGEWRLRAAGGYTGRANSALAVGVPGMPITRALRRVRDFCHVHGIPPKVQAVQNSEVETELAAAGWSPDRAHTAGTLVSVQTGPLTHGAPTDATVT